MNPNGTVELSQAQMYAMVMGVFLPILIAIIVQTHWPQALKTWAALAVTLLFAAGVLFFDGRWNPTNIIGTILILFFEVSTTYAHFWKPSTIAPTIERTTTPGSTP